MLKKCIILIVFACAYSQANASISVSGFSLTETSLSLRLSGTLPSETPDQVAFRLYLVNNNPGKWAFNAVENTPTTDRSFDGDQAFDGAITGIQAFGDYLMLSFGELLLPDTGLSGTLTATWDTAVFNRSALGNFKLYWGVDAAGSSATSGVLLYSQVNPVPEPATYAMIGSAAMLGLVLVRRLRRRA